MQLVRTLVLISPYLNDEDDREEDDAAGDHAGLDLLGGDGDDVCEVAEGPAHVGVVHTIPGNITNQLIFIYI